MSNETATLVKLSAAEQAAAVKKGDVTSRELVEAHLKVIEAAEPSIKAFLKVSGDVALEQADAFDAKSAEDKAALPELAGVPIAIKDMIVTKGIETTAASKILEGWVPPYDATVIEKLKAAGMPILGKTNLDEFAQGSSTEHSAYQTTHNPWDTERVPGGSGGGSASAVAAFEAPIALGTDTGGSIRQPGALTGTVGVKPTYGGVSRFGAIAMAGNTAAGNLEGFVYTSMNSVYQTNLSFTSQNMGAGNRQRMKKILGICLILVSVVGLVLGNGFVFFGQQLLGIYSSDPEVIQYGLNRMHLICAPYFLCGLMDVMVGSMRGMGYSFLPMIVSLIGACGLRVVWIFTVFQWHRSLFTLYLSYPITWTITALAHMACWYVVMYKKQPNK